MPCFAKLNYRNNGVNNIQLMRKPFDAVGSRTLGILGVVFGAGSVGRTFKLCESAISDIIGCVRFFLVIRNQYDGD